MRAAIPAGLLLSLLLLLPTPARTEPDDPDQLVEQVRKSIEAAKGFLLKKQNGNGNWEVSEQSFHDPVLAYPGGKTALALLALLNAGVPPDDPAIQKGLKHLRTLPAGPGSKTYVVALQAMAYAQAGQPVDEARIKENVLWLLDARMARGWSYTKLSTGPDGKIDQRAQIAGEDNSNTQYALLGLHAGLEANVPFSPAESERLQAALKAMRQFFIATQVKREGEGGWEYKRRENSNSAPTFTMTTAGLGSLLITGMDLEEGRQVLRPDGSAVNCGQYGEVEQVSSALRWLGRRFPDPLRPTSASDAIGPTFYSLYGVERVGRLSGLRFFGGHDWYEVGCRYLVKTQEADGSWRGNPGENLLKDDSTLVVNTSFALLFLSKGRTPVLVAKLAHGDLGSTDWNNKHNDLRNLVAFASRELFERRPMAWQIFDVRERGALPKDKLQQVAAQLLETPVVFLSGHNFTPRGTDLDLLREYLANGGFVFVESCCGSPAFDKAFRAAVPSLFEDAELKPLDGEHPVWKSKFLVPPGKPFPLEGVSQGCKTVLIYSPKPLASYWETNQFKDGTGKTAFELAANVLAYATGLEPPKPRGTKVDLPQDDPRARVKRGYLQVAQLKHEGDDKPAPRAMRHLMAEARNAGLDVVLETKDVYPTAEAVLNYRFLYMHGRRTFKAPAAEDLKHLRFNLKSGGTLLADACCGSQTFDKSFREFMKVLWAEDKLSLEPIPPDDELFGKALNGTEIKQVRCRRRLADGTVTELRSVPPALEGVKFNGRWVVIYSPYDIGCALENHKATDCVGHDHESALRLARAAVLYALKR
jgi:hypothetical protein